MSAFLGPIHTWLYNKVKLQDELTAALLNAFPEKKQSVLDIIDFSCGKLPEGELADIIDTANIHGWLNERVGVVEARLATAVSSLCTDEESKALIGEAAYNFGADHAFSGLDSAEDAYKALNDMLLDGMPCDRVNELKTSSDFVVIFERVNNLHASFWEKVSCDPEMFDFIRTNWVNGLLSKVGITYRKDDSDFCIEKE